MTRAMALPYVSFIVDDALSARMADYSDVLATDVLVGWQCGFEPLFVAVRSYLPDVTIDDDEAIDLAMDYLAERGWFSDVPTDADYVIR
jgi:hypothetical protein